MLIEAVIEKGQVRFLQPVQFAHDYFAVKVDIPEDEIVSRNQEILQQIKTVSPSEEIAEFKRLANDLFGGEYRYIQEKSDQEILGDVLSEKYA